ncbi:BatA domain-containing protein [Marivirga harenae]|uniref:BatA domain-containing protein n=1 Tax=Marivirga harenae TaxID=2010992 RepID=UPI0026DF1879|nr:BatA domain-containing protein [Marivirga harenae]WKV11627.1 BatA domain-containing protein [Marivirga harenae]
MNWLNPIALWGLTALIIPIIIHLWSKNKTREIAFGSIRFLKESSTLQSKRIQFSELPLLLLRLLILVLLVMLLARWFTLEEVEKQKALLLGEGIEVPQAFADNKDLMVLNTSPNHDTGNHWYFLERIAQENPEIDSLVYINNFKNTDFTGAIPKLNFNVEFISADNPVTTFEGFKSQDTLLIHFDKLPLAAEKKFDKVLKANTLYTSGKVNFRKSDKSKAHLIFANSRQKLEANQVILSDSISGDYHLHKKHSYTNLYLSKEWVNNSLQEDLFLSVVTEFIAQIVEPNYQYSSFKEIYERSTANEESVQEAKIFDNELLIIIVFLIALERVLSFRKRNA